MSLFTECIKKEFTDGSFKVVCNPTILGVLFWIVFFLGGILWLWMFVDCLTRKFKNSDEKVKWVVLLLILTLPAAIVYFFVRKNK